MKKNEGVIVQSVARALTILDCFTGPLAELGIKDISLHMKLSKSTVFGLVNTLFNAGYLEQNPDNKRYRLGIKLFEMGMLVHKRMDLRADAHPFCEELSKKYGATVHLAAKYGDKIIYIDKVDAPDAMIIYSQMGKIAPHYCTGVGKAIVAFLPESQWTEYLNDEAWQSFTSQTINTSEALRDELLLTRGRGYALDNEEIEWGLQCVASPIFDHSSTPVAAVSVSAPKGRFGSIEAVAQDVRMVAMKISKRFGFQN